MKKIADISKYQGDIDWAKARTELDFIILRASCGNTMDVKYLQNVSACDLPFGAYHYVKAGTTAEAEQEARFFVECTRKGSVEPCFYIADIEYEAQTSATTESVCVAFLQTLRTLGCEKIGLYINTRYKWAGKAISMCDLMWIPHWGKNDGSVPADQYKPKYPCDLWQYTSVGRVEGVKGNVDLNMILGEKMLEWFIAGTNITPRSESSTEATNGEYSMSERNKMPFTNENFVAFCKKMVGMPYWYGAVVYKCTASLLSRKSAQYPSHYTSGRMSRYKDDIAKKKVCADCVGLIKGYMWTNGGIGVIESIGTDKTFTSKYGGNNCPDKSANGMFTYAKSKGMSWGTIDSIPEVPGVAVRFDGHVGVYIGGGYVIEERGFNYGCQKTKLKDRKWTHWYQLPFIDYGDAFANGIPTPTKSVSYTLGSRLLKKGMTGSDVKALQELLLQLGYVLPRYGADGDYGSETEKAVLAFQKDNGLEQDGKYGEKSHKALMDAVADDDAGKQEDTADKQDEPTEPVSSAEPNTGAPTEIGYDEPTEETQPDTEADKPDSGEANSNAHTVRIVSSGKVNIRVGNGTQYARITSVSANTILPYIATATNGWHAVVINSRVGWVSGEYSRII